MLIKNKTLITLDLTKNEIKTSILKKISDALKVNTSLTELYLDKNPICDFSSLFEALKQNNSLISIAFNNIYIVADHLGVVLDLNKSIDDMLKSNTTLTEL